MNNIRCPNCGFINFVTAECCRKCETPLSAVGSPEPVYGGQGAPLGTFQSPYQYQYTQPKSDGEFPILKIFLCLIGGLIVLSVVAGGGVAFLKRNSFNSKVEWRQFRPPQGNYTVMMPTEPRSNAPVETPLAMGSMTKYIYSSAVMGQGSVLYCVVTFPVSLDMSRNVTEEMLDEELNNIISNSNSTLVSKKSLSPGGGRGLEFEFRPPAGNSRQKAPRGFGKLFFVGNEEYVLLITASQDSALLSGKDKFLNPIVY